MTKRGAVRVSGLLLAAGAASAVILFSVVFQGGSAIARPAPAEGSGNGAPSSAALRITLANAGLDARALDAAGVTENEKAAVLTAATSYLSEHPLAQTCEAYRQAARAAAAVSRDRTATATQRAQAIETLASAKSALQTARQALFAAATTGLGSEKVATLAQIRDLRWTGQPAETIAQVTTPQEAFAASNAN